MDEELRAPEPAQQNIAPEYLASADPSSGKLDLHALREAKAKAEEAAGQAFMAGVGKVVAQNDFLADKVSSLGVQVDLALDEMDEEAGYELPAERIARRNKENTPAAPVFIADLCCRKRSQRSSCDKCFEICPTAAIDFDEESGLPVIDAEFCGGCELCCAVCSSGALASSRMALSAQKLAIEKTARLFDVGYVSCSQSRSRKLSASIAEVPCLGCLPAELWFSVIFRYPNLQIYLPAGICDDCPFQEGEALMEQAVDKAEKWSSRQIGLEMEKEKLDFMVLKNASEEVGRRELFTNIGKTARNLARSNSLTDAVQQFELQKARMRSTLGALRAQDEERWEAKEKEAEEKRASREVLFTDRRSLTESRRMLRDIIVEDAWVAERCSVQVSVTEEALCTACKACVDACPMGARSIRDRGVAEVEALFCCGCGLCAEVCDAQACKVEETSAKVLLTGARLGV